MIPPESLDTARLLKVLQEQLTCRSGAPHYCPNCDNTFGPDLLAALLAEVARLRELADVLEHSNIIEIAVRNKTGSVSEYMNHWEGRALKAEQQVTDLTAALGQLKEKEPMQEQIIEVDEDGKVHGDDLEHALASALNRYSAENPSNTPDWILAQFLLGCLAAWNQGVQQRETWYGRDARPSGGAGPTPLPSDQPGVTP